MRNTRDNFQRTRVRCVARGLPSALLLLTAFVSPLISSHALAEKCTLGDEQRIVSIGGSITETIYALGKGHLVVASDTTSYFPEAAKNTPKVGYQRALSTEGVLAMRPDLLILSDHAGPKPVIEQLSAAGIKMETLKSPEDLNGIKQNITHLGSLLCAENQSETLVNKINADAETLAKSLTEKTKKPSVLFIMQHAGGAPMVAGNGTSADAIIKLSGAQNVVSEFEGYKPLSPEALVRSAPDYILTTDMGLKQVGGVESMLKLPGLAVTPAGKAKQVIAMDSLLLLGFGPRTVSAAEQLRGAFKETM